MTDIAVKQPIFNIPGSVAVSLAVLVAIHLARQWVPADWDETMMISGAVIPARFVTGGDGIPGGAIAGVTSLFTHMLLHANAAHLIMNGLWLLVFGGAVAKRLGSAGFFAFAIASGVAGALTYLALQWGEVATMIGASGAVSGLTAGALRFFFSAMRIENTGDGGLDLGRAPLTSLPDMFTNRRILTVLAIWALVNFGTGFFPELMTGDPGLQIAWQAHLGGFLFGLLSFGLFDRWFRQ